MTPPSAGFQTASLYASPVRSTAQMLRMLLVGLGNRSPVEAAPLSKIADSLVVEISIVRRRSRVGDKYAQAGFWSAPDLPGSPPNPCPEPSSTVAD